jgi:hypothetical protein
MRCLKRRLSDAVYHVMVDDLAATMRTDPGGQLGNDSYSSATGSKPKCRLFGKPLPGSSNSSLERHSRLRLDTGAISLQCPSRERDARWQTLLGRRGDRRTSHPVRSAAGSVSENKEKDEDDDEDQGDDGDRASIHGALLVVGEALI